MDFPRWGSSHHVFKLGLAEYLTSCSCRQLMITRIRDGVRSIPTVLFHPSTSCRQRLSLLYRRNECGTFPLHIREPIRLATLTLLAGSCSSHDTIPVAFLEWTFR